MTFSLLRFIFSLLALLSICILFSGCKSIKNSNSPLDGMSASPLDGMSAPMQTSPKVHAWAYLREYGTEPEDYATYSYVLVGRTDTESEAVRKFHQLIQAIQSGTSSTGKIFADTPSSVTNLFLIPAVQSENLPDEDLAKAYISALESSHERFRRPGPFIVTLDEPLSADTSDLKQMLFVDLTDIHGEAFNELVAVYKNRAMDAQISIIEHLRSLQLSLLNFLLLAEESIVFSSAAHAQMKAVFEPE